MLYDEHTIKNNISIDVINVLESGEKGLSKILATAMAPITRCDMISWRCSQLFQFVDDCCTSDKGLRKMSHAKLVKFFENRIERSDLEYNLYLLMQIPLIERYDRETNEYFLKPKLYNAYKSIRDSGHYTKIDYEDTNSLTTWERIKRTTLESTESQPNFWAMICPDCLISDILHMGYIPEIDHSYTFEDEHGNTTSKKLRDNDYITLQNGETEEFFGLGAFRRGDKHTLDAIDWKTTNQLEYNHELIGDVELVPYLITDKRTIRCFNRFVYELARQD